MEILIDGLMYSLKRGGGVGRYFNGYLPLLNKVRRKTKANKQLKIKVFLHPNLKMAINFNKDVKNIKIFKVKKTPCPLPKTTFETLISPLSERILKKYWLTQKGDIFHSTYYTSHPSSGVAQVITVYDMIHEIFPQYFSGKKNDFFRKKKKKVVESADAIVCISKNTKRDLLKFYKIDQKKIHVVYPGKDKVFKKMSIQGFRKFKKIFLKKEKYQLKSPFLFYLGPRGRNKNFSTFIKAYASWKKRDDFEIVVAGGNNFNQTEKAFFKKMGINNKIWNLGYISDKELVFLYNSCHAFIYPSLYEGFGIPLVEAMACGALVLASNRSSFPEIGKDCFLYFDPESIISIQRALNKSLNTKKRTFLIKKSLKRAKGFSWEKTAQQMLAVYRKANKEV